MISQTHILLASTLLAKPNQKLRNCAVLIGAFVPDLAIYALFVWSKIAGVPESTVWGKLYWQEPWTTYTAAGNSIPLYLTLLMLSVLALRNVKGAFKFGLFAAFFSLAALTHIATDLPVHVADAHQHLWPLSDWKFRSPISYWDPNHHGRTFMLFEAALGIIMSIILFKRFKNIFVRVTLFTACVAYVGVPVYFRFILGGT